MGIVEIRPDSIVTDSGSIAIFPSGTKFGVLADEDSNTYVYASSGTPVTGWVVGYATRALAANERCAGARIVNRKSQNYPGSSKLTSKLYQTTTYLSGADEALSGTYLDQTAAGPWRMTELTQTDIDNLRTSNDFDATTANVLLMRQGIELDIRTKPIAFPTNSQDQTGLDPGNTTVAWASGSPYLDKPQKKYRVKVFTEAVATGGGFDPATSTPVYDSGLITSSATTQVVTNLSPGTRYYAYIQVTVDFNTADWSSDWSTPWRFTTNYRPVAAVTGPPATVTTTSTPTVTWSYSDADVNLEPQKRYEVRVYATPGAGWTGFDPDTTSEVPVYASGQVLSSATSQTVSAPIANALSYRAYVRVQQQGQFSGLPELWSTWAQTGFTMSLTQPTAPTLSVTGYGSDVPNVALTLTPPGSTPVAIAYYDIERSLDGGFTWAQFRVNNPPVLTNNIAHTGSPLNFIDYEVPLNRDVRYRAVAVSTAAGTEVASVYTAQQTTRLNHNKVWLKCVSNPALNYSVPTEDAWLDITRARRRKTYEPLGRKKPIVVKGNARHDAFTLHMLAMNTDGQAAIESLLDSDLTLYVQTPKGSWYAELSDDVDMSDSLWDYKRNREDVTRYAIPLQEVDTP